ncbi:hypothetical protein BDQ17DRAFT_1430714 [Cyathus striatus]|nr:hypothetical protein BDQ17DRAFT_1430714 [Cyathus striatus]
MCLGTPEEIQCGAKPPAGTPTLVSIWLMSLKMPVLGMKQLPHLSASGCHLLSVLILMQYLYSDKLLGVWDRRIYMALERELTVAKVSGAQVKIEFQALARALFLPLLSTAHEPLVKCNLTLNGTGHNKALRHNSEV